MGILLDIALTHLRGRARQSVVAVLGVATGVGFSIAMASLMEGSQQDFITRIVDSSPHVVVQDRFRRPPPQPVDRAFPDAAVALRGLKPREELRGIRNAKARLAEIDALPGLRAAPTLRGQVVLRYGGRDVGVALRGIDPAREPRVSDIEDDLRAGSLAALHATANGIIIGAGLAEKLGAGMGDTLTATAPTGTILKMKVVGLFHTGVVGIDEGEGLALLKRVQVLQNRPNVINEIRIRLDDANRAREAAAAIERLVGYRAMSWEESNEGILEVLVIRNVIMYTVVGAILLVAGFGIFNVVSTIIHEKARDIAILKSLGFRDGDIRRIFVVEGLIVGLIGAVAGSALGYGLCRALGAIRIDVRTMTEATQLPLVYEPVHYAIAAGFAIASAVFAAWLPARRAARLDPVAIVRGAG
ncbi:MAG: ABC transporter permease [Rhodospirillaceae bacterium]